MIRAGPVPPVGQCRRSSYCRDICREAIGDARIQVHRNGQVRSLKDALAEGLILHGLRHDGLLHTGAAFQLACQTKFYGGKAVN